METYDNVVKAQALYQRMMAAQTAAEFKKVFSDAIRANTLDDFHPVVVRAELAVTLSKAAEAKAENATLDFKDYIYTTFGIRPRHLLGLDAQLMADIMGRELVEVEGIFRDFDYTLENGMVAGHPDAGQQPKVVQFAEARKKRASGDAA
jgi:hypothetical protein